MNSLTHSSQSRIPLVQILVFALAMHFSGLSALAQTNYAYPPDISSWSDAVKTAQRNAASNLVTQLRTALAKKQTVFKIAPGDYRFGQKGATGFTLNNVTNLLIDATGVNFWWEGRSGICPVSINQSSGVTIQGLTMDSDPLAYSQGTITNIDKVGLFVDVSIDPGFPIPDKTWALPSGSTKSVFYGQDGKMIDVRMDYVSSITVVTNQILRVKFQNGFVFQDVYKSVISIGDHLCFPERSKEQAITTSSSDGIEFDGLTIYSSAQMGITESGGNGGNIYRNCKVIRRPQTQRLLACNADVFHSIEVVNGPLIENCEFSNAGDDIVNITGFFSVVYQQTAPQTITIVSDYFSQITTNSTLYFYDVGTLKFLGLANVTSCKDITDTNVLASAKNMPNELTAKGTPIRAFHPTKVYPVSVGLDRAMTNSKYTLVGCSSRTPTHAIVRNNYFHDGYTRGVLLKASNSSVTGNTIERMGDASVSVGPERYWLEGPFVDTIDIISNTITDSGSLVYGHSWQTKKLGAISVISEIDSGVSPGAPNQSVRIASNTIVRPAFGGIALLNANSCTITNNSIVAPFSRPPIALGALGVGSALGFKNPNYAIIISHAPNVITNNNVVSQTKTNCLGDLWTDPVPSQDTLMGVTGLRIR